MKVAQMESVVEHFGLQAFLTEEQLPDEFDDSYRFDAWQRIATDMLEQVDAGTACAVIEHLVSITKVKDWKTHAYLHEVVLAGLLLAKVGNLANADTAWKAFLNKIIALVAKPGDGFLGDLYVFCRGNIGELWTDLLKISHTIGPSCPGKDAVDLGTIPQCRRYGKRSWGSHDDSPNAGGEIWPQFVANLCENRDVIQAFADSEFPHVRAGAYRALADRWPDESTERLLASRCRGDRDVKPDELGRPSQIQLRRECEATSRRVAMNLLVERWRDGNYCRTIVTQCACEDEAEENRKKAFEILCEHWPDPETRKVLAAEVLRHDRSTMWRNFVRRLRRRRFRFRRRRLSEEPTCRATALTLLAKHWPDDVTRRLVVRCAKDDTCRVTALRLLKENDWIDDSTRALFERGAEDDRDECRALALKVIVHQHWRDSRVRSILTKHACSDIDFECRLLSIDALANSWPDKSTRKLFADQSLLPQYTDVVRGPRRVWHEMFSLSTNRNVRIYERFDENQIVNPRSVYRNMYGGGHDGWPSFQAHVTRLMAKTWPEDESIRILLQRILREGTGNRQAALDALREHWPGENWPDDASDEALAKFWPSEITREQLIRYAERDTSYGRESDESAAENWPDEKTSEWICQCKRHGGPRIAITLLAENWRDEETRKMLSDWAINHKSDDGRIAAIERLVQHWPTWKTRWLVTRIAHTKERNYSRVSHHVRAAAYKALIERWPDQMTRCLIVWAIRRHNESDDSLGQSLLSEFVKTWSDRRTRNFVYECATTAKAPQTRNAAIDQMVNIWPDVPKTRKQLTSIASWNEDSYVQANALRRLAKCWPDATTRDFLVKCAQQDSAWSVRAAAIESLAATWPDDTCREFLNERAVHDEDGWARSRILRTMALHWPDDATRDFLIDRLAQDDYVQPREVAIELLGRNWLSKEALELIEEQALCEGDWDTRGAAICVIARVWKYDDGTRRLPFQKRVIGDMIRESCRFKRRTALDVCKKAWPYETWPQSSEYPLLAERWPKETTQSVLLGLARGELSAWNLNESSSFRRDSHDLSHTLRTKLVEKWPDEETREILRQCADADEIRSAAVRLLGKTMEDETWKEQLREIAALDNEYESPGAALWQLAGNAGDSSTRDWLTKCAIEYPSHSARGVAFELLVQQWPDHPTRDLLLKQAVADKHGQVRGTAIRLLAAQWSGEETPGFLVERVVVDVDIDPRIAALECLAKHCADHPETRDLMFASARDSGEWYVKAWKGRRSFKWWYVREIRSAAMKQIVTHWRDDKGTRPLLVERAVKDKVSECRRVALDLLAKHWPDESTCTLIRERTLEDASRVNQGIAFAIAGRLHSEFGKILLDKRTNTPEDGSFLYDDPSDLTKAVRDPFRPIYHEEIVAAAEQAGISPDGVAQKVDELSQFVGWDITKGARMGVRHKFRRMREELMGAD